MKKAFIPTLVDRIIQLYRPYFGFKNEFLKNTLSLLGLFALNIMGAICLSFINASFGVLTGVLFQPTVTYYMLFQECINASFLMGTYAVCHSVTQFISSHLGIRLAKSISDTLLKEWLETGAYYGLSLQAPQSNKNSINKIATPKDVFSTDIPELTHHLIGLVNSMLMVVCNAVVGFYGLYQLSGVMEFSMGAMVFAIPGYMAFATIAYAFFYNKLSSWIGSELKTLHAKMHDAESITREHLSHIHQHRETIAFKNGIKYEQYAVLKSLKNIANSQKLLSFYQSALELVKLCQEQFANIFALILASPNIVAKKIHYDDVFPLMSYFSLAVQLFSFKSKYYTEITECDTHLERTEELQSQINAWKQKQQQNKRNFHREFCKSLNKKAIVVENLTVSTNADKPMLRQFNATFKKGSRTLLSGPSGIGKTTVIRALGGIVSQSSGSIKELPEKTAFVSSTPYFPYNASLISTICYPEPISAEKRTKAELLMRELDLAGCIPDLDKIAHWQQVLSDGQQQRIMLIAALLKVPDCLVMDEATSRVDHLKSSNTKGKMEACIIREMSGKTVIFTDHNPSKNFYDEEVKMGANRQGSARKQSVRRKQAV